MLVGNAVQVQGHGDADENSEACGSSLENDSGYSADKERSVATMSRETRPILTPSAQIHTKQKTPKLQNSENEHNWNWKQKKAEAEKKECQLTGKNLLHFSDNVTIYEIFEKSTDFDKLVNLLVEQSMIYAHSNGQVFETDCEEMKAFLGINLAMSINKMPSLDDYWSTNPFLGNKGINEVMTRNRFKEILRNLHFANNLEAEKDNEGNPLDKGYKIRPIIKHFNSAFLAAREDEPKQSVDEHMCKFRGQSSMKQYIKNKPIKWGFKFWIRAGSESGYVYEFDLYLGKKVTPDLSLGEGVVLQLTERLRDTFVMIFFDNFFTSPNLVQTLFDRGIYSIGTVRVNRKNMPTFQSDKEMKRGDCDKKFANDVIALKWMDNRGVHLLGSNIEGISEMSTVQRR